MIKTYTEVSMFDEPQKPYTDKSSSRKQQPSHASLPPLVSPAITDDPTVTSAFSHLSSSSFRSRFRLSPADRAYAEKKGRTLIASHTSDFILTRLAPAFPENDGKQTPMRGHPTFTAQHATATCCRSCLAKWHHIPLGRKLTESEIDYVTSLIMEWLDRQIKW